MGISNIVASDKKDFLAMQNTHSITDNLALAIHKEIAYKEGVLNDF
jgi:hypothetical protein